MASDAAPDKGSHFDQRNPQKRDSGLVLEGSGGRFSCGTRDSYVAFWSLSGKNLTLL